MKTQASMRSILQTSQTRRKEEGGETDPVREKDKEKAEPLSRKAQMVEAPRLEPELTRHRGHVWGPR